MRRVFYAYPVLLTASLMLPDQWRLPVTALVTIILSNAMRGRHTLRTNRIHTKAGKPLKDSIKVISDASKLDTIYVHLGVEDKMLRMSSTYLSTWLGEHGYSRFLFTKSLEKTFGAKTIKGRIGSGTQYAGATEYLLEIPLLGTTHANFIDEA
jgi:hypothetical protein